MHAAQFTTILVASFIDSLVAIIDSARSNAQGTRWAGRIEDAYTWLLEQDSIEFDRASGTLLIDSSRGERSYHANGVCQCEAGQRDGVCYHRAAARLVKRALAHQTEADALAKYEAVMRQIKREEAYAGVMELYA